MTPHLHPSSSRRLATAAALLSLLATLAAIPSVSDPAAALAPPLNAVADPLARAETLRIVAPREVVLGRPARAEVTGAGRAATYRWDVDNRPGFETRPSTSPLVDLRPRQGGPLRVAVEVTDPAGAVQTTAMRVRVLRPNVVSLRLVPADPVPGERVTLHLAGRSDTGGFAAYAWDVEGVKPTRTRLNLGRTEGRRTAGAARAAVGANGVGGFVDTAKAGLDITPDNQITVQMPDGPKAGGRTINITGYGIGSTGDLVTAHRTVTVDTPVKGFGQKPNRIVDCGDVAAAAPSWPCAQVAAEEYPVVGWPAAFYDVTPGVKVCHPVTDKKPGALRTVRTELLDLGYPSPEGFFANVATNPIATPGGFGRGVRRANDVSTRAAQKTAQRAAQKCETKYAIPVSWRFGDGSPLLAAPGMGTENLPVSHVYTKKGSYTVTLTTKVPYLNSSTKKKDGATPADPTFTGLSYFTARVRTTVNVTVPYCGVLSVRGIATRSVTAETGTPGCFAVRESVDGSHPIYQPITGQVADVGGMRVDGYYPLGPIVDPSYGTLSGPPGMRGSVPVSGSGRLVAFEGPVLAVPPLANDPRVGRQVAALPAYETPVKPEPGETTPKVGGLKVVTTQALLSPSQPVTGVASVALPKPLGGYADVLLDGSAVPGGAAARTTGGDVPGARRAGPYSFEADLSGVDLGGVALKSGTLRRRVSDGHWEAGIVLDLPGLGTVSAPYLPAGGTGNRCSDTFGPSGLELTGSGGFVSGGVQVDWAAGQEPVLGPVSLGCAAIKAQAAVAGQPFAITGLAQVHAPPEGPITADGCAGFSLVAAGQSSTLCSKTVVAPSDLARLTATADISLYDGLLELGDGSADLTAGPGGARVVVTGHAHDSVDPFYFDGDVEGGASTNPTSFYLIGGVDFCLDVPWLPDPCAGAQLGVSDLGFGACADLGGFVYYWDPDTSTDVFFFSCDLAPRLTLQARIARRNGPDAGRDGPGATSVVVPVPDGQSKVAFAVHRADDVEVAPQVTLVGPSGQTYVTPAPGTSPEDYPNGDGVEVATFGGSQVGEGVTTFTVPSPQGGDWTVQGDGRTLLTVELATPVPEPSVTGAVTLSGAQDRQARLAYDADLAPGDIVRVIESGPEGIRTLGALTQNGSTLSIPTGPRGPRTVTAIVERQGIPYRTFVLDGYQAPGLADLAAPERVRTSAETGRVVVRWDAVTGATSYRVVGALVDGRLLRRTVTGTSLALPGSSRFTGGRVRVVARAGAGRDSEAGVRALDPVTRVRVAL